MKTSKQDHSDEHHTEMIIEAVQEDMGINPAPGRDNESWIKALESRLRDKRQEFSRLLDDAAENEELLSYCGQYRREIEQIKRRLAAHIMLRDCRN